MAGLDLTSFAKAVQRLEEGLARCQSEPNDVQLRDGLVQRFEITYELSHKMLKRVLEIHSPSPEEIDHVTFADLIRTGNEQGLLKSDWSAWRTFREMRSRTSHTFDESSAKLVLENLPTFCDEAKHFLGALVARQNSSA